MSKKVKLKLDFIEITNDSELPAINEICYGINEEKGIFQMQLSQITINDKGRSLIFRLDNKEKDDLPMPEIVPSYWAKSITYENFLK